MTIKEIMGLVIFSLGIATADSESLIVPTALIIIGIFLIRDVLTRDKRKE